MRERPARRRLLFGAIFATIAAVAMPALAQTVDIRTVVLTGDAAPGTTGATFQEFVVSGKAPALNNLGHVAFFAILTGRATPGRHQGGVWQRSTAPELRVLGADIAPDTAVELVRF